MEQLGVTMGRQKMVAWIRWAATSFRENSNECLLIRYKRKGMSATMAV